MIAFACPHCSTKLKVKPEFAGRQSKCPGCKQPVVVPMPNASQPFVPPKQIDGTESSLAKVGLGSGITLSPHDTSKLGASASKPLADRKNRTERYVIEGEIARGGMGAVLRAVDCDICREVAVKYLLDNQDPKRKARFFEEAQINGQLEHPNIVPVYDLGIDAQKRPFLMMKMVKGRSLKDVLDQLRDNPKQAEKEYSQGRLLNILVNVCNALAFAHSRGVIHRDLKPANIMLGDFGEVYVMDWGLAKVVGGKTADPLMATATSATSAASAAIPVLANTSITSGRNSKVVTSREPSADLTQDGAVLGTAAYMPPEQATGRIGEIDQRSDVYSLGAILYEMLTLQPPVDNEGGYLTMLMRVTQGEIVPPEARTPDRAKRGKVPKELSAIAMKALAKAPQDRYPTVEALRKDIERFQEGRSVSAKQDTFKEMAWKLVKRNKAVSAALFVLLPVLVVLLGVAFINYAASKRNEAALADRTRKAVPALVVAARQVANGGKLKDALEQVDLALAYEPKDADARLLKGQLLLGQKDWPAARGELERYLEKKPNDADAKKLHELCSTGKMNDTITQHAVADILQRQNLPGPAIPLLQEVERERKKRELVLAVYRKQIEVNWPGLGGRIQLEPNAQFSLDFRGCMQVTTLEPLKTMQLDKLILAGCEHVKDLTPLKGMPLTSLDLVGCGQVSDLKPLEGMRLTWLNLDRCASVRDLSPLAGLPLTWLNLGGCGQVSDLSPLKGMPLNWLGLHGCSQVRDLKPLEGMPLAWLRLGSPLIRDLTPLRGMPLTTLDVDNAPVEDLTPLKGMPLATLILGHVPAKDLTPLKGLPLTRLEIWWSGNIRDLTPLKGLPLIKLYLCGTNVDDLSPLEGMPLQELLLPGPPGPKKGHAVLRGMKSLKMIGFHEARLRFSPEEFWKKYDASQFK
jgi:serine/threonine protein kinase